MYQIKLILAVYGFSYLDLPVHSFYYVHRDTFLQNLILGYFYLASVYLSESNIQVVQLSASWIYVYINIHCLLYVIGLLLVISVRGGGGQEPRPFSEVVKATITSLKTYTIYW